VQIVHIAGRIYSIMSHSLRYITIWYHI